MTELLLAASAVITGVAYYRTATPIPQDTTKTPVVHNTIYLPDKVRDCKSFALFIRDQMRKKIWPTRENFTYIDYEQVYHIPTSGFSIDTCHTEFEEVFPYSKYGHALTFEWYRFWHHFLGWNRPFVNWSRDTAEIKVSWSPSGIFQHFAFDFTQRDEHRIEHAKNMDIKASQDPLYNHYSVELNSNTNNQHSIPMPKDIQECTDFVTFVHSQIKGLFKVTPSNYKDLSPELILHFPRSVAHCHPELKEEFREPILVPLDSHARTYVHVIPDRKTNQVYTRLDMKYVFNYYEPDITSVERADNQCKRKMADKRKENPYYNHWYYDDKV